MIPDLLFNIFPVASGMRARVCENTLWVKFGCPEMALFYKNRPESAPDPARAHEHECWEGPFWHERLRECPRTRTLVARVASYEQYFLWQASKFMRKWYGHSCLGGGEIRGPWFFKRFTTRSGKTKNHGPLGRWALWAGEITSFIFWKIYFCLISLRFRRRRASPGGRPVDDTIS